jgi:Predicted transcriptional regulator, BolA superfamily|tara:strand:- start:1058 stop:1288 length:231 start_codon:yes stop_codon:yes gene_type:complete
MDNNQIQELIRSFLDDVTNLTVSGQDCNFSIKIVSKDFTNMSTLERHKSIMKLFSDLLKSGELHAISLDLKAPSEV